MPRIAKLLVVSLSLSMGLLVVQAAVAANDAANVKNVKMVHRFYEEVGNQKNLKALPTLFAPRFTQSYLPFAPRSGTVVDLSSHLAAVYAEMPDFKYTVNNVAGQNNTVFAHWSASGTRGGKAMKVEGITMFRLTGGKISEMVVATDPGAFSGKATE
jgi:predicted SnoaL-like aldol condensation-catalyzing enzyme